jgi:predicted SAM-dependent methyltransferase
MKKFIVLNNQDLLCPKCGSLPRTRRLFTQIQKIDSISDKKILHFSPPKSLANKLKELYNKNYITTDYVGEFNAEKKYDITQIDENSQEYDVIVCYHVLEHIEEDIKAMKELFRILKTGGICIFQTPFKDGDIYEDYAIQKPEDRLIHFGQEDHVRIYSVNGLEQRLKSVGFETSILHFSESENNYAGFKTNERIILCKKCI